MRNKKSLLATCFILLLVLFLISCTSTTSSSTPAFNETTTTPPITTGDIQGKLLNADTKEPLAGAAIILGLVTEDSECTLDANLIALTGTDGTFQLSTVPPGTYVVFYNPSGEVIETWQETNGLKIKYELIGKPHTGTTSIAHIVCDDLGGCGMWGGYGGLTIKIENGIIESIKGSFALTTEKYGIVMQFKDEKPLMLETKAGETTNIEIMAIITEYKEGEFSR